MSATRTDTDSEAPSFADFGVADALCAALERAGITSPFPIQELTLPMALAGADVIGQARTGTGKTLAFGLPALQRVDLSRREVQAFVIVPTRELCLQVSDELTRAGADLGLSVEAVFGGRPIEPQAKALKAGAHVVVGTPGRLLDLYERGMLDLSAVRTLVLDEADEMLDLGFLPDVERLIEFCPAQRQTLLFSATMPPAVVALARRYMDKPTFLRAEDDRSDLSPDTAHHFFSCHRLDKPAVLARILQTPKRGLCVVFTRTKRMADQLAKELADRDVDAAPIHSDLRQEARERALRRFREGKVTVLVATEVAARGLDIDDVTHVVNYDCPDDEKMYLHRIGRTGRAGAAGSAITLAVWNELARLEMIKKAIGLADEPTHEVFSTSELLDELFDLPEREPTRRAPNGTGRAERTPRDEQSKGEGSKRGSRRKRGGRRRKGSGQDRARGEAEVAEVAATVTEADDRPAREAAGAAEGGNGAAADVDGDSAPTSDDGAGTPTRQRTRTRRRTRTTTEDQRGRAPAADGDGQQPEAAATAETGEVAGAPETGEQPSTADGEPREQRAQRTSSRGQRQGGSGRRSRGGKRGGKRDGKGKSRQASRPAVSSEAARGEGQPRIRRPLQVEHLP